MCANRTSVVDEAAPVLDPAGFSVSAPSVVSSGAGVPVPVSVSVAVPDSNIVVPPEVWGAGLAVS